MEDSGLFKTAAPELADYIKAMSSTACFLFIEKEVDKRGKLYKAVKEKGRIVELSHQDERTLIRWLLGMIKQEGKQIREETVRYILSKAGTDMANLEKEMEKLFCYTLEKEEITIQDVDAVCTTQITNHIFDMVEAVAKQQKKKALDYYYDLLALKEPPMRIMYLLTRQFQLLLQVKELVKKGMGRKQVAEKAGLHPFAAGKYMDQCRNFSKADLIAIMEEGAEFETDVKTGRLNDVMSVELFILSTLGRNNR